MLAHPEEHVFLDARRHGVVLVPPLLRALMLAVLGSAAFLGGWPVSVAGAALLVVAAVSATAAVWRWDRTHVVLTEEKLFVMYGGATHEGWLGRDRAVVARPAARLRHDRRR
jgi:hypothetical protein